MIAVIQPNADKLADAANAGTESWIALHNRQLAKLNVLQRRNSRGR
jgi:hypothetical protein